MLSALRLLAKWREGHPACKQRGGEDGGGGHWLVRMEWRPAGWSVRLPLRQIMLIVCKEGLEVLMEVVLLWFSDVVLI